MLLKYRNLVWATEQEAYDFFDENEKEIMSIYSQYCSMFEYDNQFDDEELAVLCSLYLIFGKDEDIPDRVLEFDEEELSDINDEFLDALVSIILISDSLYKLEKDKLVERVKLENGKFGYKNLVKPKDLQGAKKRKSPNSKTKRRN